MLKKKPLRADAERNRQHVLEVAQAVFAAEGLAVPIDEIARRAGLGVGTLYRHFPTKEALFEAIILARMELLVDAARTLNGAPNAGKAFFEFLSRIVAESSAKKDFIDALTRTGASLRKVAEMKAQLRGEASNLLARAQKARAVRADIAIGEVFALLMGTFHSLEQQGAPARARARMFDVICDGLRPPR